jgi:hypothetical protein
VKARQDYIWARDLDAVRTWPEVAAEFNRRNSPPITKSGAFMLHQSAIRKLRRLLADLHPNVERSSQ